MTLRDLLSHHNAFITSARPTGVRRWQPAVLGLALALQVCFAVTAARGQEYPGVSASKLVTSSTAANGQKLSYLQTDSPEVTALIVEIPPGAETGWHMHQVPVYGYVLAGNLSVEMADGARFDFKTGDPILEVVNTAHNGRNPGDAPTRLVVFYTGAAGVPNVTRTEKPAPPR